MALGMAEYRSGHYAEAEAALLVASRLGKNNYRVADTAAFYRAMSLYRQGNEAEARKLASEAVGEMKSLPKDENHPLADNVNHDDLILWLAYKEAKALIKFEAVPTAPASLHHRGIRSDVAAGRFGRVVNVDLFQKAVNAGFKDIDSIQHDTELDPLREREDFKTLLVEVEKRVEKK